MTDWIHCNKCYEQPNTFGQNNLYLTNCGHLFCDVCTKEKPEYCFECKNNCSSKLLSSNLGDDIRFYFLDLENYLDEIKKNIKAIEFQRTHRQKYFMHLYNEHKKLDKELKNVQCKYNYAKEYINKMHKKIEELQNEKKRLRDIIRNTRPSSYVPSREYYNPRYEERTTSTASDWVQSKNGSFRTPLNRNSLYNSRKSNVSSCFTVSSSILSGEYNPTPNSSADIPIGSLNINSRENISRNRK